MDFVNMLFYIITIIFEMLFVNIKDGFFKRVQRYNDFLKYANKIIILSKF